MQEKELLKIVNFQIDAINATLSKKSKEYSTDDDKLHNFKKAAELQNISLPKACCGMMTKHTISIYDLVKNYNDKKILPSDDVLNEKIGDLINYLILLKACFIEEKNKKAIVEKDNIIEKTKSFLSAFFQKIFNLFEIRVID